MEISDTGESGDLGMDKPESRDSERPCAALEERIRHVEASSDRGSSERMGQLAELLTQVAVCYSQNEEKDRVFAVLDRALYLYSMVVKTEPQHREHHAAVAVWLSAFDSTRLGQQRLEEALRIYEQLADESPEQYGEPIAELVESLYSQVSASPRELRDRMVLTCQALDRIQSKHPDVYLRTAATAQNMLGNIFSGLGELNNAVSCHQEAIRLFESESIGSDEYADTSVVRSLNLLGLVLDRLDRLEEARDALQRAVLLARRLPETDVEDLGISLANLGLICFRDQAHERAITHYREAIRIFQSLQQAEPGRSIERLARILINAGDVLLESGDIDDAEDLYGQSVQLVQDAETAVNPDLYALARFQHGEALLALRDFPAAADRYLQALTAYSGLDLSIWADRVKHTLSRLMSCANQLKQPLTELDQASDVICRLAEQDPSGFRSVCNQVNALRSRLSGGEDIKDVTGVTFFQNETVVCPVCATVFETQTCLILDARQRPDLFENFQAGTIHESSCPSCQTTVHEDAPMVLYRADHEVPVVFVPARKTSAETDQQHAGILLGQLRGDLGDTWRDAWVQPLQHVSQEMCRFTFSDDAGSMHPMEVAALAEAVRAFCNAESWRQARDILADHGDLLTPLAGHIIEQLVLDAPDENKTFIEEAWNMLRRCQEIGAEEAFLEIRFEPKNGFVPDEVVNGIKALLDAPTWEATRETFVAHRQALLSGAAEAALREVMAQHPGVPYFEEHRRLLAAARHDGVEAAFSYLSGPKIDPYRESKSFRDILFAPTWEATTEALESYLANGGSEWSERLAEEAILQSSEFEEGKAFLEHHLRIIELARAQGVDDAMAGLTGRKVNPFDVGRQSWEDAVSEIVPSVVIRRERSAFLELMDGPDASDGHNVDKLIAQTLDRASSAALRSHAHEQLIELMDRRDFPAMWSSVSLGLANLLVESVDVPTNERADNIKKAVEIAQEVVSFLDALGDPELRELWGYAQLHLGESHRNLRLGDRRLNQENALACYREAEPLFDRETRPRSWALVHHYLGCLLGERLEGAEKDNLEDAIRHYELSLEVRTPGTGYTEWAMTTNNLGRAYERRIVGDHAQNLEKAISLYKSASAAFAGNTDSRWFAEVQFNLGSAYRKRLVGERADNLREAIRCHEKALAVSDRAGTPFTWAKAKASLGATKVQFGELENGYYAQAIDDLNDALQVFTLDTAPDDWATVHFNTASAWLLSEKDQKDDAQQQAREHIEKSLRIYTKTSDPKRWGLAQRLLGLTFLVGSDDRHNRERGIDILGHALTVFSPTEDPYPFFQTARHLATAYFEQCDWNNASRVYEGAWQALDKLYELAVTDTTRHRVLSDAGNLVENSAYCLARLGQVDAAVVRMEAGKARRMAELFDRDRGALLNEVTETDRKEFLEIANELRNLEQGADLQDNLTVDELGTGDYDARRKRIESTRQRFEAVSKRIRSYLPDFMQPPSSIDDLQVAAGPKSPLVYLTTTSHGSVACVVARGVSTLNADDVLWLDDFDTDMLTDLLLRRDQSTDGYRGYLLAQIVSEHALEHLRDHGVLEALIEKLRGNLMQPLARYIERLGYSGTRLVPLGQLSLLPLHAALMDVMPITFLQSARLVLRSEKKTSSAGQAEFFGLGNPLPHGHPLVFAAREVQAIAEFFPVAQRHVLVEQEGRHEDVIRQIPTATHLHFACHGKFSSNKPLESALDLAAGEQLTLRELLDGNLDLSAARLAVLSACETGLVDYVIPDEEIGLSGGFLYAGASGVVSALWPVNDLSTSILMEVFYRLHLKKKQDPVVALYEAQRWLRTATVEQMDLARRYQDVYASTGQIDEKRLAVIAKFKRARTARPFSHPYYWAGFRFSGIGTPALQVIKNGT